MLALEGSTFGTCSDEDGTSKWTVGLSQGSRHVRNRQNLPNANNGLGGGVIDKRRNYIGEQFER